MSAPSTPPPRAAAPRPRANYADPAMRVSDAERSEVADRLSQHYGDGRLDQEEFGRRLDQAMGATTQADLNGLFADLPDLDGAAPGSVGPAASRIGGTGAGGGSRPGAGAAGPGLRDSQPGRAPTRRPRRPYHQLVGIVLIVVIAIAVGHALAQLAPLLLIVGLAFLWLRRGAWPGRRT